MAARRLSTKMYKNNNNNNTEFVYRICIICTFRILYILYIVEGHKKPN